MAVGDDKVADSPVHSNAVLILKPPQRYICNVRDLTNADCFSTSNFCSLESLISTLSSSAGLKFISAIGKVF